MEYSEKDFVKDFISRTYYNIQQLEKGPYEVTQLINSTVGLLLIPKEKYYKRIKNSLVNNELLKDLRKSIIENTYTSKSSSEISLRHIVRHIRNGFAHGNIEFDSKESTTDRGRMDIYSITIKDHREKNDYEDEANFEIRLTIQLLKEFLIEFSQNIIS